jgi:hypothetical protein
MQISRWSFLVSGILVTFTTAAFPQPAVKAPVAPDPRAEKIIQALQKNTAIRAYQWTETMVVMMGDKEKTKIIHACSYNEEGRVVRTPGKEQPMAKNLPGTKSEIDAYAASAVALMREYVRPNPAKLEACLQAGRVTVAAEKSGSMKLDFKDYLKPGDHLVMVVDPGTNQIASLNASTYMVNSIDRAHIQTEMTRLPDGTGYPSRVKLDTPNRAMGINVTNSDYRKKTS